MFIRLPFWILNKSPSASDLLLFPSFLQTNFGTLPWQRVWSLPFCLFHVHRTWSLDPQAISADDVASKNNLWSVLHVNEFVANSYVIGGTYLQGMLSIRLQLFGNRAQGKVLRVNAHVCGEWTTNKEPVWAVYFTSRYLVSQVKGALDRILGRNFDAVFLLA